MEVVESVLGSERTIVMTRIVMDDAGYVDGEPILEVEYLGVSLRVHRDVPSDLTTAHLAIHLGN